MDGMDAMDSMSACGRRRRRQSGGARDRRVARARARCAPETWFHGHKWPPGDVLDGKSRWHKRLGNVVFPAGAWSSQLLAIATIGEFVQASRTVTATLGSTSRFPDYGNYPLADELDELAELIEYRPGVHRRGAGTAEQYRRLFL